MNFTKSKGYIISILLALIPVLYWLFFLKEPSSFFNFSTTMRSFGKLTGLFGMVLFSLTLLFNTRFRFTEKLFFGLDKTYKSHHLLGTISFAFLLFHPIFLASSFITDSIKVAFFFLIPFGNTIPINLGIFALLMMIVFLFITFYSHLKYQTWKITHKFMGVAFILASVHVLLIPSDVSRDLFLRTYFTIFIIIGTFSFLYRTVFWKTFVKRFHYKVERINDLGGDIIELVLEPFGDPLVFKPGQFVFISLESDRLPNEQHPFTISSSPNEKNLRLSIKNLGDYTSKLKTIKPQTLARIEGPYGRFSIDFNKSNKYLWIAGGIGITPFLSMARSLKNNNINFDHIDMFYCFNNDSDGVFLNELKSISRSLPKNKFNVYDVCNSKKGYLDLNKILNQIPDIKSHKIFICGPPPMMRSLKEQFINYGIPKENIIMEEFGLL